MKNLLKYIFLVICTLPVSAQSDKNFVLSKTYKQAGDNSFGKVSIQIQYLDGLGRPLQNQAVGQSTTGTDIIEPVQFDAYGRQVLNYLPYAGGGSGAFQDNAASSQSSFYSTNVPLLNTANPGRPFQETTFESSPDARPLGTRAPGDKSVASTINYTSNITNEVKKYTYTANADITQTISSTVGYYDAGKLFRKETTDENQKTTVEFTDIKGRLICKVNGTFSTYYVYDDFGLLRAVLQPRFQDSDGTAEKFAFLYDYDERGRVITKKLPGAGKADLVYDNFDRLVMSQDANQLQRGGGVWSFIKYDALNRKIMTGERALGSGLTRSTLQTSLNSSTAHHEDRDGSVPGYTFGQTLPTVVEADILNATYYDKYYFQGVQSFATPTGITIGTNTAAVKSMQTGSRTRMLNDGKQWMVATNYYDSELRTIQSIRQLYDFDQTAVERVSTKYKYDLAAVIDQQKTEQTFSISQTVPDPNGSYPLERTKPENGGNLRTDNIIDQIVVTGPVTNSHLRTFTYDHADRLLSVKEQVITGLPSATKEATTIAQRYNVLGQLKEKWYHSANGTDFRRETIYTNNIRGWETEGKTIFKKNYNDGTLLTNYFTSQLSYGDVNFTNGNVSTMVWSRETETFKGLSFRYDETNRLKESISEGGYADTENINYDSNGNIMSLTRAGSAVDQLVYSRDGNQLQNITDNSGNASGFKIGGAKTYSFDPNGNVTFDANKAATITYSLINLPKTINLTGTPSTALVYDYDASGNKHKYTSSITSGTTTTVSNVRYEGPFEYDKDKNFQRLALAEGQAILSNNVIKFNYYIKDHLGNVRMVFDESVSTLQKTDYYPFGLEIDRNAVSNPALRNSVNRYNFLGKETQIATGYIDLQARFYDPLIGRFMAVDPDTEGQDEFSPYHYSFNNPIRFSDPNGRWPGEGLFKSIKNWLNTPLTNNQRQLSRGLNESFTGRSFESNTRGEVLATAVGQGLKHYGGHMPGSMNARKYSAETSGSPKSNAAASTPSTDGYVFRGDSRKPTEIFTSGFKSKGGNLDLADHTANNPDNSAYISTSTSPNVSRDFAGEGGYVYTIKRPNNGIDVNRTLGNASPFPHEQEISVPGGVAGSLILGSRQVGPSGKFIGPFIKNPDSE